MKSSRGMTRGKGLVRALNRRGSRSEKSPPSPRPVRITPGATVCKQCGAVFARKTWRRDHRVTLAFLDNASWRSCPACEQSGTAEGFGRIILRGAFVGPNEDTIRRRIENVAERASFTQPQRRITSISQERDGLEVITTSQKLAHRIVHELKKTFRGRASYAWSDRDGTLSATWERNDLPAPKAVGRKR